FELLVLEELGFGLDLSACAATGRSDDLAFVSPKTGRAVSREAGAPWAERLLPLPAFVAGGGRPPFDQGMQCFRLTGHFLARHVWEPRGLAEPTARASFLAAAARALQPE